MSKCNLCPRHCDVNRKEKRGFCNLNNKVKIALVRPHFDEEPIISGDKGSGTIFFSGCNLKCVYCQNYEISHQNYGKEVSDERLAEIFRELEQMGVHNINLVSPTPYVDNIINALNIYRPNVPIVYNTHGYDDVATIKKLKPYVDIYLTDFKYADDNLGKEYSKCADYCEKTLLAIKEMKKNQPYDVVENGLMKKGVIIRHLVLPNHTDNSIKALDIIKQNFGNDIILSVMAQYTPCGDAVAIQQLNRPITKLEYKRVVSYLQALGFENGFVQELESSGNDKIPQFNLNGV